MFRIRGECACDDIENTVCKLLLSFASRILCLDERVSGNDVKAVQWLDGRAGDDVFECDDDRVKVRGADPSGLCFLVEVPVTNEDDHQI